MKYSTLKVMIFLSILSIASQAPAWHDQTHLAICKTAGLGMWYNCAGPDIAKIKAGNVESYNHWFNNTAEAEITPQMVLDHFSQPQHGGEKVRRVETSDPADPATPHLEAMRCRRGLDRSIDVLEHQAHVIRLGRA